MPPKPRGRGSTRARAGARGGATVGRAADSASEATESTTPQTLDAPAAREPRPPTVVPKEEGDADADADADAKPPTPAENGSRRNDDTSVTAIPQEGAEASTRPPVQRLGGLRSAEPSSRSASPSVKRGSTRGGKKGPVKPTFTGRRSKEERAALEKEALEREKIRNREREKEDAFQARKKEREAAKEASRATRGRGGYSGAMSGPFSLGSSKEDRKTNHRSFSGFGAGSGSRAVRVKNEGDEGGSSRSGGYGGGGAGGGGGSSSIKREDGGIVESSEDEEDQEFPRRDIDLIEISDDEDGADVNERPLRSALPIRITRKEHQEKALALNTDASAETAPKDTAEAIGTAGRKSAGDRLGQTSRKGKGKASDVEVTGVRKPFKGVWQDTDDSDIQVKTEHTSDDEQMPDAEQVGMDADQTELPPKEEPLSPTTERKARVRSKSIAEPVLQTDEDRAEWARFLENRKHIRAELGPDETPSVDTAGDTAMGDGAATAPKPSVRDNNVYLFQIPPLMPELLEPGVKKESTSDTAAPTGPTPLIKKETPRIKLEEAFSDPAARPPQGPRFASGLVGKLRVRQSGRTTLDWGGTCYELAPGNKASFLQEVVSIHVVPEKDRVVPEDAGEAVSFGRVKGKFVVTPDWAEMLG